MKFTIIIIIWLLIVILLETSISSGCGFLITILLILGIVLNPKDHLKEE